MTPKSITDNVKYSLGKKTLLIYVYDDSGKEIAHKLFVIGYKKGQTIITASPKPKPYLPLVTTGTDE